MLVKDLLTKITYNQVKGNIEIDVSKVISFDQNNTDGSSLMWVNEKNSFGISSLAAGVVICPENFNGEFNGELTLIYSQHPRRTFNEALKILYRKEIANQISPSALIHDSVDLKSDVDIGHHVIIEDGCVIGSNVNIGHNTVLHANTVIGNDVSIGANCTVGGVGFGYEKDEDDKYEQIVHIGNVVIHDNVEIGNNTCIDRAVLGSTVIERNVKIDNLVHIAHGVHIHENALIIANSMIAGSVSIGKNSWISPSASILNKTKIGNNTTVGMGAVVLKPTDPNEVVVGNPAKSINK